MPVTDHNLTDFEDLALQVAARVRRDTPGQRCSFVEARTLLAALCSICDCTEADLVSWLAKVPSRLALNDVLQQLEQLHNARPQPSDGTVLQLTPDEAELLLKLLRLTLSTNAARNLTQPAAPTADKRQLGYLVQRLMLTPVDAAAFTLEDVRTLVKLTTELPSCSEAVIVNPRRGAREPRPKSDQTSDQTTGDEPL
jgi:hypothetical protein